MIIVVIVCVRMKTRSAVDRFLNLLFQQTFKSFRLISKNREKSSNKGPILNVLLTNYSVLIHFESVPI